jgi:hypothetical protein
MGEEYGWIARGGEVLRERDALEIDDGQQLGDQIFVHRLWSSTGWSDENAVAQPHGQTDVFAIKELLANIVQRTNADNVVCSHRVSNHSTSRKNEQ